MSAAILPFTPRVAALPPCEPREVPRARLLEQLNPKAAAVIGEVVDDSLLYDYKGRRIPGVQPPPASLPDKVRRLLEEKPHAARVVCDELIEAALERLGGFR